MAYSIQLPDGTLVQNIPDEVDPSEAKQRIIAQHPDLAPKPQAKPGMLESGLAGIAGGLGSSAVGFGAGVASMAGADKTAAYLDQKRKAIGDWQKQHGGDTLTGMAGDVFGGAAPALGIHAMGTALAPETLGVSEAIATLGTGAYFGIPAFRDKYIEEKQNGASTPVAIAQAMTAAGLATFGGKIVGTGGKVLPKSMQAGAEAGLGKKLAVAGAEGAVFPELNRVAEKSINAAAGNQAGTDDKSWMVDPKEMAAGALGFAGLRGVQHPSEARAAQAQADAKAAAAAAAAQKAKEQQEQAETQRKASPEYARQTARDYLAAEQTYAQAKAAHVPPAKDSPTFAADHLLYEENAEKLKALKQKRDELAQPYAELMKAGRIPAEEASQTAASDSGETIATPGIDAALAQARAKHADAIQRAATAAKTGDFETAKQAQQEVQQHGQLIDTLQRLSTPKAPLPRQMSMQELQQRVTALQNKYAHALSTGEQDVATAHLKELQELQPKLEAAKKDAADMAQRDQDLRAQKASSNEPNPHEQFLKDTDTYPETPEEPGPEHMEPTRGKNTTHQQQSALFDDLEPGGKNPAVGPISELLAQIDQLKNRPNMPAATLAQLEGYEKALSHPAMEDTSNAHAQNALEIIKDNVNRIAYRGEGAGVVRKASQGEVAAQIAALNDRITQNRAGMSESVAAMRSAKTEQEKLDRSNEYAALRKRAAELQAQMAELVNGSKQVNLTPYERDRKQAVTSNGPATETQKENSKKWIEGAPPRAGSLLSPWQLEHASEEDLQRFQEHLNEEWARKTKMQQADTEEAKRTGAELSHPFMSGNEVMHVNAEPLTEMEHQGVNEPKKEVLVGKTVSTDRGLARVERGTKDVVGVEREGPEDASLRHELQQLSPEDQHTVGLWDKVFGADSAANRMVAEADAGLRNATTAVAKAKQELETAQAALSARTRELTVALRTAPELAPVRHLQGQELEQQRAVEQADARVENAKAVGAAEGRTADERVRATQEAAGKARAAYDAAQAKIAEALKAFKAEWARIQRSGEITAEFLNYVNGHTDVASELSKAEKELQEVLERSPAKLQAQHIAARLNAATRILEPHQGRQAEALRDLLTHEIPKISELMGPRVAQLYKNVLRLRGAVNVIGEAQRLANAHAALVKAAEPLQKTYSERAKEAQAAIESSGKQMTQSALRVEIAQHEANAALKKLQDLQESIKKAITESPAVAQQTAVNEAKKRVTTAEQDLKEKKAWEASDILSARVNKARAEATRKMLFENENALRNGRRMPLLDEMASLHTKTEQQFDAAAKDLNDTLAIHQFDAADLGSDVATLQDHLKGLSALEGKLTALLQEHVHRYTDVQDQVQTMIDSNALLSGDIPGSDVEGGQRVVDKAMVAAELRHLSAEQARNATQRDAVLGRIQEQLDENAHILQEKVQSEGHKKALEAQRQRLLALQKEKEAFFNKRHGDLEARKAALEPERDTSPDPEVRGRLAESIENLKGLQERMRQQIEHISSSIDSLQGDKTTALDKLTKAGENSIETMRRLGLSDREAAAPTIRKALLRSLEHQRAEEAKANKKVDDARAAMEQARQDVLDDQSLENRAELRNAFIRARNAYREAVNDRATLHDHLMHIERQQLEMVRKLMEAKESAEPAAAPKQEGSEKAPEPNTTPAAIASVADALEAGKVKGAEPEPEHPETAALKERVQKQVDEVQSVDVDSRGGLKLRGRLVAALSRELGALRSKFEGIFEKRNEARHNDVGEGRITRASVAKSEGLQRVPENSPFGRAIGDSSVDAHTRDRLLPLQDQIRFLEDKIEELKSGRPTTLQRIVNTQPAAGRRGPVMKKEVVAGDQRTGSEESKKNENKTGPRNPATEQVKHEETTPKQAVEAANKDTAPGTQLRMQMERAQLEREADDARTARAAAQERYDAVMAAPKASDAAKAAVKTALEAAKKRAAAADKALAEGTKTAPITKQREADVDDEFARGLRTDENSTKLDGDTSHHVLAGDIGRALDSLSRNGSSPEVRALAEKLKPLLTDTRVKVTKGLQHKGAQVAGLYTHSKNLIEMNPLHMSEEDLLHEMVHAATMQVLSRPEHLLTADQRAAVKQLQGMFVSMLRNPKFRDEYAMKNMEEFVSEVYSNPHLRAAMDSIGKPQSLLKRAWSAVKRLLGFGGDDTRPDSRKAMAAIDRIMEASGTGNAAATPSLFRGTQYSSALKNAGELAERTIATKRPAYERLKDNAFGRAATEFETKAVDSYAGIAKHAGKMDALAGTQMMHYLRMYNQRMNLLGQAVGRGFPELKKIIRPDGRNEWVYETAKDRASLDDVAKILRAANKMSGGSDAAHNLFSLYEVAKRAGTEGLEKLNYSGEITQAQLDQAMREIKSVPGLKEIFDRASEKYREFNHDAIKFGIQTGAFSKELGAKMLANKDYVPYYRESQDGSVTLMMGREEISRVGNVKDQPYLHELVGGDTRILDFSTAAVRNANMLLDMGLRNQATKNVAIELQKIGLAETSAGDRRAGPNTLHYKVDGVPHFAIVKDTPEVPAELLVKGMEGLPVQQSALLQMAGTPSRLLRHAFVANPISAARILFKDTLSSAIVSGSDLSSIGRAVRNVGDNLMERRGISGGEVYTGLPADMANVMRQMQSGKPGWEGLLAKLYSMHAKADALTRQTRYEAYRKQGLSEMEATHMALESMNFTRRGISPSIHILNTLNPFINSQIQGVNMLVKGLRGNAPMEQKLQIRQKLFQRGMMIAGGSMLYAALMQDDPAYQNATPDQKYNNFFMRVPGADEPLRIPIPFEAGILFKSVPEALMNYMYGHDKDAAAGMRQAVQRMIPGGDTYGIPQFMRPAIEAGTNHNFYTGRSVETRREQSLLPEARVRDNTSGFARALGEQFGISPVMVDHLIGGYTGQMGLAVAQMASSMVFNDRANGPTKGLSQQPLVGSLFQPEDAGAIVEEAYQSMDEAQKVHNTVMAMAKKGQGDAANAFLNQHADAFAKAQLATKFTGTMTKLQQAADATRNSTELTPEQKRDKLKEIQAQRTALAKQVLEANRAVGTAPRGAP